METIEVLQRIHYIEMRTRRLVNELFAGSYHSVFKGRGIAFDSVRAYEPGDDVRAIDWNVTARTGEPFVKNYAEERELTVMLALDASASIVFGTQGRFKRDLAAELGAVLAFSAIANNDKVGLLVFSDQIELFIPPRKGRKHVLRLIRDLMTAQSQHKGTDLALGIKTLHRSLKRRTIIFLISDFLVSSDGYMRELMLVGHRHDVIAVTLSDPLEQSWPSVGLIGLRDAETHLPSWVNTSSRGWRRQFSAQARRFTTMRETALAKAQVDRIDILSDGDYVRPLIEFFRKRERRFKS
jgi:uncharacterized protein (DUF58 family)